MKPHWQYLITCACCFAVEDVAIVMDREWIVHISFFAGLGFLYLAYRDYLKRRMEDQEPED